jgi:hypothetical protein
MKFLNSKRTTLQLRKVARFFYTLNLMLRVMFLLDVLFGAVHHISH